MDRKQANALIQELGERVGLPQLSLDDAGTALVAIDDGAVIVTFGHNAKAGTIEMMTCLDEIAPSGEVLLEALSANFAWFGTNGATFAVDPNSDALVLQRRCNSADVANGGLFAALEALVASAAVWSKRLTQAAATPVQESVVPTSSMMSGMLRA
jgi:Tir chaperone protein (CesT) family